MESIAIIGAGIIGSSTAYYLTRHAQFARIASLTLIEGSSVASGASGKAGGLLALDWHGPATTSLAELSYRLHRELAEEHGGASRWGYRTLETLSIDAHVERKAKKARTIADSYAWLNADILAGAPSVLGTTATTAQAHPAQLTAAFADLAQERGAKLVHDTVKTAERTADGRIRLGLESGESIVVDKVVVCAGPWTGRLASELQINLGRRANKIEGSRAHSIVLKPRSGSLPAQALFTNIKQGKNVSEPEIYNRPDNTAYACGPTDGSELPIHASDVQVDPKAVASIQANVAHLSPLLSDADILTRQACYLPVGSGDPVIGQSPTDGFYVAAGHSCWGICNGPGTGQVMAELILDGRARSADISALAP